VRLWLEYTFPRAGNRVFCAFALLAGLRFARLPCARVAPKDNWKRGALCVQLSGGLMRR